jgi:hypothetical protein
MTTRRQAGHPQAKALDVGDLRSHLEQRAAHIGTAGKRSVSECKRAKLLEYDDKKPGVIAEQHDIVLNKKLMEEFEPRFSFQHSIAMFRTT